MNASDTVERDWTAFSENLPDGKSKLALAVEGIYCPACMTRIEKGLMDLDGGLQCPRQSQLAPACGHVGPG